jgi:amidase
MATVSFKEKIKGIGGDASYEAKARVLREQLEAKIPADLKLPPAILEDPPLDITRIPETCGLLTAQELAITELDATAVCQKIAAGELTAVEAVTAFGKRAAIAHQLTACLMDFFLDEGIKQAQQLDEYFQKEGKVIGPLHGLPISVKVSIPSLPCNHLFLIPAVLRAITHSKGQLGVEAFSRIWKLRRKTAI